MVGGQQELLLGGWEGGPYAYMSVWVWREQRNNRNGTCCVRALARTLRTMHAGGRYTAGRCGGAHTPVAGLCVEHVQHAPQQGHLARRGLPPHGHAATPRAPVVKQARGEQRLDVLQAGAVRMARVTPHRITCWGACGVRAGSTPSAGIGASCALPFAPNLRSVALGSCCSVAQPPT